MFPLSARQEIEMIGLTIMEISSEQMQAIVQWYLNNNLLNITFQKHHKSQVESVRQRSGGRFVIEFRAQADKSDALASGLLRINALSGLPPTATQPAEGD